MPAALLSREVEPARQNEPNPFHELQLYHSSQHHVEAEARLIQALPAEQVVALFEKHCAQRLVPLKLLIRDPWLMAVDKPAGLLSQPGLGPEQSDSVITRLQQQDQSLRLVHRLDRDTSGVLLLARSADALSRLSALFAERRINKLYQADVEGELHGRGCIASSLARLSRNRRAMAATPRDVWR